MDRSSGFAHAGVDRSAEVKRAVRERYAAVAARGSCGCGGTPRSGPSGARSLELGCGNPLPVAGIRPGDTVLDLGSGSGEEVLLAGRMTGPAGRAIGVDMTEEMLALARRNAASSELANVEFHRGEIEALPLPDGSVDVIVSNCVLNLSPDKPSALAEAFRVLRPGGRFVVADVVIPGDVEPDDGWRRDAAAWSRCESGAMSEAAYERGLREAGFVDIRLERIAPQPVSGAGHDEAGGACCTPGGRPDRTEAQEAAAPSCCGGRPEGEHGATALPELASDLISARKPEA